MKHSLLLCSKRRNERSRIIEYKSYDDCMELLAPFNESLLESYVNNEIIPTHY